MLVRVQRTLPRFIARSSSVLSIPPEAPEIRLETVGEAPEVAAERVVSVLIERQNIGPV